MIQLYLYVSSRYRCIPYCLRKVNYRWYKYLYDYHTAVLCSPNAVHFASVHVFTADETRLILSRFYLVRAGTYLYVYFSWGVWTSLEPRVHGDTRIGTGAVLHTAIYFCSYRYEYAPMFMGNNQKKNLTRKSSGGY
jgi:hypothetical protein